VEDLDERNEGHDAGSGGEAETGSLAHVLLRNRKIDRHRAEEGHHAGHRRQHEAVKRLRAGRARAVVFRSRSALRKAREDENRKHGGANQNEKTGTLRHF